MAMGLNLRKRHCRVLPRLTPAPRTGGWEGAQRKQEAEFGWAPEGGASAQAGWHGWYSRQPIGNI